VVQQSPLPCQVGTGHTHWATHGQPSENNAHPHLSDYIAVVHNGINENSMKLKEMLTKSGQTFVSETDAEVISHLMAMYIRQGAGYLEAVQAAVAALEGSYASVMLNASEPHMAELRGTKVDMLRNLAKSVTVEW
jgi:glucosamine--fructose-6-phosphate aminotransferase (isomerizing)